MKKNTLNYKEIEALAKNGLSNREIAAHLLRFGVYLVYFLEMFLFLQNIPKKIRYLKI